MGNTASQFQEDGSTVVIHHVCHFLPCNPTETQIHMGQLAHIHTQATANQHLQVFFQQTAFQPLFPKSVVLPVGYISVKLIIES